jgi:trimeric autotransporter adhesin
VGTNALANGAVDAAKLANGAVTNDRLGPNAVTGAKIAGATITAANIASGQVVKGGGSFATGRQVVADGAINTPVLTLSGVGQLRATCVAGVTSVNFLNEAGAAAEVTAWGVDDAAVVTQQTAALANGAPTAPIVATGNVLGLTYQVVSAANVTTADISAAPAGTSCAVVASGLTTG